MGEGQGAAGRGRVNDQTSAPTTEGAPKAAKSPSAACGEPPEALCAFGGFLTPADRKRAIYEARVGGATYKAIAREFGISNPRVRQILRSYTRRRKLDTPPAAVAEHAPPLARRLTGEVQSDAEPLTLMRDLLTVARRAGYSFDDALSLAAEAVLSYRPELDAREWWDVIESTRSAWRDAYEGAPSPLEHLPRDISQALA